jgi:hypothetical protein
LSLYWMIHMYIKDEDHKSEFSALDALAARINDSHRMCATAIRAGAEHAMNCGDALMLARAKVDHGEWLSWLARNCAGLSPRMAQRYVRIAKNREFLSSNATSVTHLTISGALERLAEPKLIQDRPHAPLPDPGHELFGQLRDGRWIHLTAAEDPGYCFVAILDADLGSMSFFTRCVRREAIDRIVLSVEAGILAGGAQQRNEMVIESAAGACGTGKYEPGTVDWREQQLCKGWPGIFYEGYSPAWKQGSAENPGREIESARAAP